MIYLEDMKIKNQEVENDITKFPFLDDYTKKFNLTETLLDSILFAYNNIVYTKITPENLEYRLWDYVVHEQVHFKQQEEYGLDNWINLYLTDDNFRLKMELEAYGTQSRLYKDKNKRAKFIEHVSNVLSSPMYGGIISKKEVKFRLS